MEVSFKEQKILVTGAGQGIGRQLVKQLVACGGEVVALSRTPEHLETLKQECPSVKTITCDLIRWETARRKVEEAGPFNCLVNNAGVAKLEPFLKAKIESFDEIFNVNVKAMFNVSQVVAGQMVSNNIKGTIVNISSQASQAAFKDHALYCASKGAVDMLSKTMALELGEHGIRVNCVNPTVVMTNMGKLGWSDPEKSKPLLQQIPLGRFAVVSLELLSKAADPRPPGRHLSTGASPEATIKFIVLLLKFYDINGGELSRASVVSIALENFHNIRYFTQDWYIVEY